MISPDDSRFMKRALELAERGWGRVSPNPLVGAVVVRDGKVVGEGWHREYGLPHAEVEALRAAGDAARGATLYVTLEPCAHHGKTAPCTDAILAAGIARLVYAARDPNPKAAGGADALRARGVEVDGGVEEESARSLNAPFFRAHDPTAPPLPWTDLKLALSLDGLIADRGGRSAWITSEAARAEVHRLRAGYDAIAVGIGTVLADDPLLTARGTPQPRTPPMRVVFDRELRLPASSRLVRSLDEAPVVVMCDPDAPLDRRRPLERLGVHILEAGDLRAALAGLHGQGVRSVFCEGGARIASALLTDHLVDRMTLFYAPLLLGKSGVDPFAGVPDSPLDQATRWKRVRTAAFGPDTLICVEL